MKNALKKYFGYDEFRPFQEEIINDLIKGKDVLVLMPTGGGKSMCYQLPSVILEGTTIVISPLISLMKDQVDGLKQIGIKAEFLNSTLTSSRRREIEEELVSNKLDILYVAPERFANSEFIELLKSTKIDFFAVDEAHCISEWGHDFRPDYRELKNLKKIKNVPIIALTATATQRVAKDIASQLDLKDYAFYKSSFDRTNLGYTVKTKVDVNEQILEYLNTKKNQSGIIYCFSRDDVDSVYSRLKQDGFKVLPYHAGLSEKERTENQEMFINDEVDIIVATVAFGMGIDKPDVRFVIHKDLPSNIERYYQETGRAGRDGLESDCLLFYSYADKAKIEYFISEKQDPNERDIAYSQLNQLINFAETTTCRRKEILNYFGESYEKDNCNSCDNCLNPTETFDATIVSTKILSCIVRLHGRFGVNYVAKVLTGSRSKDILSNRHNKLSVYGIVNDYSTRDLSVLIRALIRSNYIKIEGNKYPVAAITEKGIKALKEKESIFLPKLKQQEVRRVSRDSGNSALFEELRALRKEIAIDENVPPYLVFSDVSLQEMAEKLPRSIYDFMEIKGVGSQKAEKYGESFLTKIKDYLRLKRSKRNSALTPTAEKTMELYKKGLSIEEIAKERDMVVTTIIGHIEKAYLAGEKIDIYQFVSKDKFKIIEEEYKSIGKYELKPTKENLGDEVEYFEIGLVRAKLEREEGVVFD